MKKKRFLTIISNIFKTNLKKNKNKRVLLDLFGIRSLIRYSWLQETVRLKHSMTLRSHRVDWLYARLSQSNERLQMLFSPISKSSTHTRCQCSNKIAFVVYIQLELKIDVIRSSLIDLNYLSQVLRIILIRILFKSF